MGVIRSRNKKGHLECDAKGCLAKSHTYNCSSAAWELDLCEQAHANEGWGFTCGFFAMMAGPQTLCPEHAKSKGS